MPRTDWLSPEQAVALGAHETALISSRALIYGGTLKIGAHSRIDAGCLLNGEIEIGERVHIAPYCLLYGKEGIGIMDYAVVGPFSVMHTEVDNFDGTAACGVLWPRELREGSSFGPILLGRYAALGTRVTVFAGVMIQEGAAVGASSLVMKSLEPWTIYAGSPVRRLRERDRRVLELCG